MLFHSVSRYIIPKKVYNYCRMCRHKNKNIQNKHILLIYIMAINVLFQGIIDVVLKFVGYAGMLVFPYRVDFLFLTAISVLLGWQSLKSMKSGNVDTTKNNLTLSCLVEISLVVGDVYFIFKNLQVLAYVSVVRMPFVILTALNIVLLLLVMRDLQFYKFFEYRVDRFLSRVCIPFFLSFGLFSSTLLGYAADDKLFDNHHMSPKKDIQHHLYHRRREVIEDLGL